MQAFYSEHKNREHLHFWGVYFGPLPTTCGAGTVSGHWHQFRMAGLGIMATFGSKGRGVRV